MDDIITVEFGETEEKILTNEVSDEALEAAASDMLCLFSASIQLFHCQFC